MNEQEKNVATISGTVVDEPVYNHQLKDDKFYTVKIAIPRLSGTLDVIPVMLSENILQTNNIKKGDKLAVVGQFRSYNQIVGENKSKLLLSVFARKIVPFETMPNVNKIELDGFVCKQPIYRKTPLNKEIGEVVLAVNRNFGKSDYIPCIAWGDNARIIEKMIVSNELHIEGRIQSREYEKKHLDTNSVETKIAYEVSISKIEDLTTSKDKENVSNL